MDVHKVVAVHLWDSIGSIKIAVFSPATKIETGELCWALYPKKPITFVEYDYVKRDDVAYLNGKAAKLFLERQGYKKIDKNKTIAKI